MCALSHHIREKPNWWEKVKDEAIVEKWREEALQQEEEVSQQEGDTLQQEGEVSQREEEVSQQEEEGSQQEEEGPQQEEEVDEAPSPLRKLTSTMVKSWYL